KISPSSRHSRRICEGSCRDTFARFSQQPCSSCHHLGFLGAWPATLQMASVGIISGAGTLGGNHRGAHRMLGGALLAESRTIVRLLHALEHEAADAGIRLI